MPAPPEAITGVVRAAQKTLNSGEAQKALALLEALPQPNRSVPVLRLQGLCLQLLGRHQEAQDLASAAEARHTSYPFRLLQAADLAWHRRDHWPALLACIEALQQQPRLHNLWARIMKIAIAIDAKPADSVPASSQEKLRSLLIPWIEKLSSEPNSHQQLERIARLLPLLPVSPARPQLQAALAGHCCNALAALQALNSIGTEEA